MVADQDFPERIWTPMVRTKKSHDQRQQPDIR